MQENHDHFSTIVEGVASESNYPKAIGVVALLTYADLQYER
jgi:hypothetical protein